MISRWKTFASISSTSESKGKDNLHPNHKCVWCELILSSKSPPKICIKIGRFYFVIRFLPWYDGLIWDDVISFPFPRFFCVVYSGGWWPKSWNKFGFSQPVDKQPSKKNRFLHHRPHHLHPHHDHHHNKQVWVQPTSQAKGTEFAFTINIIFDFIFTSYSSYSSSPSSSSLAFLSQIDLDLRFRWFPHWH